MQIRRISCLLALLGGGLVLTAQPVSVSAGLVGSRPSLADLPPLQIVSSAVVLSYADQTATFDLKFNRAPEFYTLDSAGRVADSFQYFINSNWSGNTQDLQLNFGQFTDVVRGDEINTSGKLLIRDASTPANPDPNSGGWGPVIAALPFEVQGNTLTFAASFNQLRAPKGTFSYEVYSTHFGSTVSTVQAWAVPLPAAVSSGLAMLGVLGSLLALRKLHACYS